MELNNETYSFQLEEGNYYANFAFTPSREVKSHQDENYLLFKGILNGNGNFGSHKCIIRTNSKGTEESWNRYCEIRKMLKSVKKIFQANNCASSFYIPKSALAIMEREAFPSKIVSAFSRWRRPKKDEWVLVDLYQNCYVENICTGPLFSAISHISLEQNQEKRYLTNFRAFRFNRNKICITSADISTDIAAFKRSHQCTEMCWLKMPFSFPFNPIASEKDIEPLISCPMSAPVIGDFNFWCKEPTPLPPYTPTPMPTAPPMFYLHPSTYPSQINLPYRQLSV